MSTMSTSDPQHPLAFDEGVAIGKAGSYAHVNALSKLARLFEALFDGPRAKGDPAWVGASLEVDDFCSRVPGTKDPAIYAEPFWGPGNEGVTASFCVTAAGRPVLMSLVAFAGPRASDPADNIAAKVVAIRNARRRAADL